MDVEAEIRDLKRRVGELEGSFGFLTRQVKPVHKDLLAFQARTEQFQARTEQRLDRVEKDVRVVREDVRTLRQDLPGIVADAVREGLRERPRKSRKTPRP